MHRGAVPNISFTPTWTPDRPRARAPNAPSIPNENWDLYREDIIEMYIHCDWKLDDVMRVMIERYSFCATKRQYTKKLRDWDCKKYNIDSRDDASSQFIPASQDPSFRSTDKIIFKAPMGRDNIILSTAPASDPNEIHGRAGLPLVELPVVLDNMINPRIKAVTAADYIAVIGDDTSIWAGATEAHHLTFNFDFDNMDGALEAIPEETPAPTLSKTDDASTEDGSTRDQSSVSSADPALKHSGNACYLLKLAPEIPSSPAPNAALVADQYNLKSLVYNAEEPYPSSSLHGGNTIDTDFDWGMVEPAVTTDAPSQTTIPTSTDSSHHPVFVLTPTLMKKLAPAELLHMINNGKVSDRFSEEDTATIKRLAMIFEHARCYDEAYSLRRLVLIQADHLSSRAGEKAHAREDALVLVLKCANNANAYGEAATSLEYLWSDDPLLANGRSITGILLHSYFGSIFRARSQFGFAEHHCRRALDDLSNLLLSRHSSQFKAAWLVVVTNLVLTWEMQRKMASDEERHCVEFPRPEKLANSPETCEVRQFAEVVRWCLDALIEDNFWKLLLPITPDLWLLAPTASDLQDVESTLLFFYLLLQLQPGHFSGEDRFFDNARSPSDSNCVVMFSHAWGIPVTEVLSVVANYIIAANRPLELGDKSSLVRRASTTASAAYHFLTGVADVEQVFVEAYTAVRRQKERGLSTEKYTTLVRTTMYDIVARNFHLGLEVNALRDPRLQNRLSQASMSPSYTPTMLSTPRSSWSGFRSFKSIGRRGSKIWLNTNNSNNDVGSLLSSRRWSRASSIKSAGTPQSTTPSDQDAIMDDDVPI